METYLGLFLSQHGFSLSERIQSTPSSVIYSAIEVGTSETVSVRLIPGLSADLCSLLYQHYEEMRQLDTLPSIRKLINSFRYSDGKTWMIVVVMEKAEGNLEQEIEKRRVSEKHWSEGELMKVASDLSVSLAAMQERGVSGRPISIRDVFYRAENRVTLSDFSERDSEAGSKCRRRFTESDIKEDVLCLGVVLSHCVRLDCESFLPSEGDRQRYPQLLPIISSMLAASPSDRPDFLTLRRSFFSDTTLYVPELVNTQPHPDPYTMGDYPYTFSTLPQHQFTAIPHVKVVPSVDRGNETDAMIPVTSSDVLLPLTNPIPVAVGNIVKRSNVVHCAPFCRCLQSVCCFVVQKGCCMVQGCCNILMKGCCNILMEGCCNALVNSCLSAV